MLRTVRSAARSIALAALLLGSCEGSGDDDIIVQRDAALPVPPSEAGSDAPSVDAQVAADAQPAAAPRGDAGPGNLDSGAPELPDAATHTDGSAAPITDAASEASAADAVVGAPEEDPALGAGEDAGVDATVEDATVEDATVEDAEVDTGLPVETRYCGRILCDCTLDGIPLYGRVRVVSAFGDFQVREDDPFADLRVEETVFADSCGEWEFVDVGEDFTIEWTSAFEDFSIRYEPFPGLAQSPL